MLSYFGIDLDLTPLPPPAVRPRSRESDCRVDTNKTIIYDNSQFLAVQLWTVVYIPDVANGLNGRAPTSRTLLRR